jgi:hypothetical protein
VGFLFFTQAANLRVQRVKHRVPDESTVLDSSTMAFCIVSYLDTSGIRHTVELEADGLYEAIVMGVAALREHDCDPGDVCPIEVEVRKTVKHSLTLRRVREWLQGASRSPKEAVIKERLRELL